VLDLSGQALPDRHSSGSCLTDALRSGPIFFRTPFSLDDRAVLARCVRLTVFDTMMICLSFEDLMRSCSCFPLTPLDVVDSRSSLAYHTSTHPVGPSAVVENVATPFQNFFLAKKTVVRSLVPRRFAFSSSAGPSAHDLCCRCDPRLEFLPASPPHPLQVFPLPSELAK